MDSVKVTRVEVIGHDGREFSKMLKDSHYEVAIQDDGRTMKLFETEKEDGQGYKHRGASQFGYDSDNCGNTLSSADSNTISSPEINSFTAHGFEVPEWDGEILKEVDGYYIGYVIDNSEVFSKLWSLEGMCSQGELWNLTPIKKHWYDNPDNFPAMCVWENSSGGDGLYIFGGYYDGYLTDSDGDTYQANLYRLATKKERDSLYVGDD